MQSLSPVLTPEIEKHVGSASVARAKPYRIASFRELVRQVARLAYLNKDNLLFFRGQAADHLTKAGGSTLYPSIYRGDPIQRWEVQSRFDLLEAAATALTAVFKRHKVAGYADVRRKKAIQWSVLQHYEVCLTPLLDVTHSLMVACSFAQESASGSCYVYVLGLPQLTNRISYNSEQDLVNVRLLSICPPDALRPYFQEGYLVGTPDITSDYDTKAELDLVRRLIAKFEIPTDRGFWGKGFGRLPRAILYPNSDLVDRLCEDVKARIDEHSSHTEMGEFLNAWNAVERDLIEYADPLTQRVPNVRLAIELLLRQESLTPEQASSLDKLRKVRNRVVHGRMNRRPGELRRYIRELRTIGKEVSNL